MMVHVVSNPPRLVSVSVVSYAIAIGVGNNSSMILKLSIQRSLILQTNQISYISAYMFFIYFRCTPDFLKGVPFERTQNTAGLNSDFYCLDFPETEQYGMKKQLCLNFF